MHITLYNPKAPKKSANLSSNNDHLMQAKQSNINISKALEQRLVEMLLEEKRRTWRERNKEAIDAYNLRVETSGVFSDEMRSF